MAQRHAQLDRILYPPDDSYTLRGFSEAEVKRTEEALGVRLPKAYVDLLRFRNGARLRFEGIFPEQAPPKWHTHRKVYEFDSIAGVHKSAFNALSQLAHLARDEWGVPASLIPFVGDGHWWLCLDYRKCGPRGEPSITHFDTECKAESRVARSFTALLDGLVFSYSDFMFALNDGTVRGEPLDRILRGIGCKPGRYKHPETWDWPKYRGEFAAGKEPAYLQVFTNDALGLKQLWFPDRPAKFPILCVQVLQTDQNACIRELAAALGPGAELIHQPPDRSPVSLEGLPSVTVKSVGPRKPILFAPAEAHRALWDGDLAKVKDLLKRGMNPNQRHSADTRTPIELAAINGHTAILKLLLKHAEPPFRGDALGGAVEGGHLAEAKMLLSSGAVPKSSHLRGAALCGHPRVLKLLLDVGLRPTPSLVAQVRRSAVHSEDPRVLAQMERDRRAVLRTLESATSTPVRRRSKTASR